MGRRMIVVVQRNDNAEEPGHLRHDARQRAAKSRSSRHP
jgi:hypothetical protein